MTAPTCVCGHSPAAHHPDEWSGGHWCSDEECDCYQLRPSVDRERRAPIAGFDANGSPVET